MRKTTLPLAIAVLLIVNIISTADGQISTVSSSATIAPAGNELTQIKITVARAGQSAIGGKATKTLSISDVPVLEAGDVLTIQFCEKCPGRSFSDLGYKKMLVFFINPASVANDLNGSSAQEKGQAIAEIKFDGDPKSKRNASRIYGEHKFIVPYRSIPLIFFVSDGDYKNELRKTILEKQADVLKLSEQATLVSQLPEAVSFLLEVKTALQTPAAANPDFLQSFVQRAQYFKFNQTNCFQQTYLYPTDEARLGCLVKNVNPDQLTNDIQSFNFTRLAETGAAEGVAQLRLRYQGLSIFFDAAGAAIEIIGRLFKKKPLNVQLATLQSTQNQTGTANTGVQLNTSTKSSTNKDGFLSLRQIATNAPANTEKALIVAPLKWKEAEEIIQPAELQKIDILALCRCLHPGKNTFWLDTDSSLIKQEIKSVSIVLEKKFSNSQDSTQNQLLKPALAVLPVNPADGSLTLALDDNLWRKIKDWRQAMMKITLTYAFETVTKEIDVNIPQTPNWQILRNWNEPVKKSETTLLRLTPNTAKRECLDRIVLTDERKQSVELSPLGDYTPEPSGQISLNLTAALLDKLQAGKITVEVYENGTAAPTGKMTFTLVNK